MIGLSLVTMFLLRAGGVPDDHPDFTHERCHIFLGGFDENLPVILAHGPTEEVEPFFDPHNAGRFCGQAQARSDWKASTSVSASSRRPTSGPKRRVSGGRGHSFGVKRGIKAPTASHRASIVPSARDRNMAFNFEKAFSIVLS
jgi:hypothetical protein